MRIAMSLSFRRFDFWKTLLCRAIFFVLVNCRRRCINYSFVLSPLGKDNKQQSGGCFRRYVRSCRGKGCFWLRLCGTEGSIFASVYSSGGRVCGGAFKRVTFDDFLTKNLKDYFVIDENIDNPTKLATHEGLGSFLMHPTESARWATP